MAEKKKRTKKTPGRPRTNATKNDLREVYAAMERVDNALIKRISAIEGHNLPKRVKFLEDRLADAIIEGVASSAASNPLSSQSPQLTAGSDLIELIFPRASTKDITKWTQAERLILAVYLEAVTLDAVNIEAFLQLSPAQQAYLLDGRLRDLPG